MRAAVDSGGKSASQCSQLGLSFNMTCAKNTFEKLKYLQATIAALRHCHRKILEKFPRSTSNTLFYKHIIHCQRIRVQHGAATTVYVQAS